MKHWILAVSFLINIFAMADCQFTWQNVASYNLDFTDEIQVIEFRITRNIRTNTDGNSRDGGARGGDGGASNCDSVSIRSESLGPRSFVIGEDLVQFNIYTNAAGTIPLPLNGNGEYVVTFPGTSTEVLVNFFIKFEVDSSESFLTAGDYSYNEVLTLYENGQALASQVFNFDLEIRPDLSVRFYNAGSNSELGGTLLFSKIENLETVEVDAMVIANLGYSLWISSLNGGKLVHDSVTNKKILYDLYVSGQNYGSIGNTSIVIYQSTSQTSSMGNRVPLSFVIKQDVSNYPAGVYKDTIVINVQAEM